MKNKGIIFIAIYLVLVGGLFLQITSDYCKVILLLLFPLALIFASINLSREEIDYKHRPILITLSSISVILYILPFVVGRLGFGLIWDYANYLFYCSFLLLLISCLIVVKNAIVTKSTFKNSLDVVIILIPLTSFFITEFYLKNSFIHKQRVERIDLLSIEIRESNKALANVLGVKFSTMTGLQTSDSLVFGSLIEAVNNVLQEVLTISGGFKIEETDQLTDELLNPHNTSYSNMALRRSTVLEKLHDEFERIKSRETNKLISDELTQIQTDLFGGDVILDNSVLEMRIRCYTAENRLLSLEIKKKLTLQ